MIFQSVWLTGIALVLFRVLIAIVFFSSGKSHLQHPKERAKSIGLSKEATAILGVVEILGALLVALGIFTQIGTLLLIFAMLGAICKKIFVWKVGFYAEKGFGWHYDLLLLLGCLVIFCTDGGVYTIV